MSTKHAASEEPGQSQPLKRVRIDPSETQQTQETVDDEFSVKDSESDYGNDEADEQAVRKAASEMAARTPLAGAVRQAGAIEQLELFNFMCHKYFVIDFGPQANFIIGQNGSGKSAILTGIIIALGGKASATSRATSLKGFIKHDESRAEVKLQLSNRGEDAFRPDVYGDKIIIERSINKDGGGGFKLKSARDKIVSAKKEELQAILDHFMIQADNPLNILSQDDAKIFLSASSSKEKYGLFIRGTQLQHLTNEYEEIQSNITTAKIILDNKRDQLSDIHNRAKTAKATLKEVEAAAEYEGNIVALQREVGWAYVEQAEQVQMNAAAQVEVEEHALPKYAHKVQEAEGVLEHLAEEINQLSTQMTGHDDEELERRRDELKKELRNRHEEMRGSEIKEKDADAKRLRLEVESNDRMIEEENAKASRTSAMSRQEAIQRREACDAELKQAEARLTEVEKERGTVEQRARAAESGAVEKRQDIQNLERELQEIQRSLNDAHGSQVNRFAPFGREAERVNQDIEATRWNTKPLGPLGLYVQCKDKKWAQVIETILNSTLKSYLVTNQQDEQQLRKILTARQCKASICRTAREEFEYASGEPDENHLTVLRVLSFTDEFVKRALINAAKIEKTILVEHRTIGDPIMTLPPHHRRNIDRCYTKDGYSIGGMTGGGNVMALTLYRGAPRIAPDRSDYIAQRTHEKQECEARAHQYKLEINNLRATVNSAKERFLQLKQEAISLRRQISQLRNRKGQMDDELAENASSNLAALEHAKEELEKEIRLTVDQCQELFAQRQRLQEALKPALEEKEKIDRYFANKQSQEEEINSKLLLKTQEQTQARSNLQHYKSTLIKHEASLKELKAAYDKACEDVKTVTAQAIDLSQSSERFPHPRSLKKLIAEMHKNSNAVKQTTSKYGTSLDLIRARCQDAAVAWKKASAEFNELGESIKTLKQALQLRRNKWLQFRAHISVRARMKFINHLLNRGYTGKLSFDHHRQRLEVHVDTNSDEIKQAKLTDPRGLSGGERSFSTISLLLTLWDAVNCPIRCLDEFDVFMDVPHRKVAVKMMVGSAREANEVQYVFITPQDLDTSTFGPETRISRMAAPERRQGA